MALIHHSNRKMILLMIITLGEIAGCKSRDTDRSGLWSVTTAAAFGELIKNGRSVAPSEINEAPSALNLDSVPKMIKFAGIQPVSLEMDNVENIILHATFNTANSIAIAKSSNLVTEAQRLLLANASTIGINPTELVHGVDIATSGWQIISFRRVISGIVVRDARVDLVFANTPGAWRLAELNNRGWGRAEETGSTQTTLLTPAQLSSVTSIKGLKIAANGVTYIPRYDARTKKTTLHRANWYEVRGDNNAHFTMTFSGSENPTLVEAYSHAHETTVVAPVFERSWKTAKINLPIPDATINGSQKLDKQGSTTVNTDGASVSLSSEWATIATSGGGIPKFKVVQQGGAAVLDTSSGHAPELNTYMTIARIRQFVGQFLTESDSGFFRQKLTVTTQIQENCNAFYQGATLNFYSEGQGCADMATVNDVVMHEWGHGLDDFTGPGSENGGGITDHAFSEAIGDITAMLFTGDNKMAAGFHSSNPDRPLRNLDNKLVYTQGQEYEMHKQGTIVGGAFWELRRRLVNKYGVTQGSQKASSLFFQHLKEADSYQDSYNIILRLADDDGNPATKSPDFCIINHSFAVKRLATQDPCTDDFDTGSSQPPQNTSDLTLAIVAEDAAGASFQASTANATVQSIELCAGQGCTTSEVSLKPGTPVADRRIFSGTGKIQIADGKILRMMAKDASGTIISSSHVRFRTK